MDEKLKQHIIDYKIRNRQHRFVANFNLSTSPDEFLDSLAKELANGADLIIFKTTASTGISLEIAKKAKLLAGEFDATFLIYDRADIAFLIEPDGILLDENSISEIDAKKILGHEILIIKN
ncbi:MAG: thiamine phosphate synthase [Fusobacterium sp.]|nr:thiamine phosphate synthase [Fusobacterium sp.]